MPAGRPRKPTAVLELSGAFKKDPQRRAAREGEPEPNGAIGDPPNYFDAEHAAIWHEFVDEAPIGVLQKSDRKLLEHAVRLTRKARNIPGRDQKWITFLMKTLESLGMSEADLNQMRDSLRSAIGCSAQELTLLASMLTRMGMTPADRSRVNVPKPPEKEDTDPFASFAPAVEEKVSGRRKPN